MIRELLVPAAITLADWDKIYITWKSLAEDLSLLEFIAIQWLTEVEIIESIRDQLGVDICLDPVYAAKDSINATGHMLEKHGFRILEEVESRQLLAGGSEINPDLKYYLGKEAANWKWVFVSPIRRNSASGKAAEELQRPVDEYAISRWLRELILGIWTENARDIHFEVKKQELSIRAKFHHQMKVVGVWRDGRSSTVVRLLSTWAGIFNWDQKTFADGLISLQEKNKSIEFRISLLPTVDGMSLVLRAPTAGISLRGLRELGLPETLISTVLDTIRHNPGLIICTGRTGSGKTTTLYGILREISSLNLKVMTIEDPVEVVLPFAVQCNLDEQSGWTFDTAVYSFLRQDPDVIMLGEIRDAKSAEAACRAALTGHCVLSTMHAGDCSSAVHRLKAWNIPRSVVCETLNLIIHQKLVTKNSSCLHEFTCKNYTG